MPKTATARIVGNGYTPSLYTTSLVCLAIQVVIIASVASYYDVGVTDIASWISDRIDESDYLRENLERIKEWNPLRKKSEKKTRSADEVEAGKSSARWSSVKGLEVFTKEQLSLFDGTRASKHIYLAILGRVYDVQKGAKHYGPGGSYHFFAGKDATRAFVSGDFTPKGLIEDTSGLSNEDLLGIRDWVSFYEKDYKLVGVVQGAYYDVNGAPTELYEEALRRIGAAEEWRASKNAENEVFPPCNSEWHKDRGGRVWCSTKSGGVNREWAGVPRLLFDPSTKGHRCACVKNFGAGLSGKGSPEGGNRGDLDHPGLKPYPDCSENSNSCKVPDN